MMADREKLAEMVAVGEQQDEQQPKEEQSRKHHPHPDEASKSQDTKRKKKWKKRQIDRNVEEATDGWYTIYLDVDKSKFFDPQYAVLEGDIWKDVPVTTMTEDPDNQEETLILKRQERCFVMVRGKESTSRLYNTLVTSQIAQDRTTKYAHKPQTTGWLRHELYGLQAAVRLPLGLSSSSSYLTANRRGIKCLDLPGKFVGLFDAETLESMLKNDQDLEQLGTRPASLPQYTADKEDVLTMNQSDLQERMTRHHHFAKWLIDTFGMDRLNQGTGVLDIAGGNGKLSTALTKLGVQSCTIIDPQPMIKSQGQINVIAKPLVGDGSDLIAPVSSDDEAAKIATIVKGASLVVGLHPDQATEAAMDLALQLQIPFAILPCCVMSRLFPDRKGRNGEPVRTVYQLCRYLMAKEQISNSIQVDYLPFMGRNKVLYWIGTQEVGTHVAMAKVFCQQLGENKARSAQQ